MPIRRQLKDYPLLKKDLLRLKLERDECLDTSKRLLLDATICDTEKRVDTLLSELLLIEDGLARTFIIDHFIEGKSIQQLENKFCYSREWIYKKIAVGINEISKNRGYHEDKT